MKLLTKVLQFLGLIKTQLPPSGPFRQLSKVVNYSAEVHLPRVMHIVKGSVIVNIDFPVENQVAVQLLSTDLLRVDTNLFIRKSKVDSIKILEISDAT